ncbi:MAG TPA: NusA-like transcription termination signal-binding factor [Nitrososphaerales archaeon]|nr:NusA-like transcription termination signal-binding factor [Nitrososphaerales archaeon]
MNDNKIKLTSEELGLMSLFQNISGATARDCVIDPKAERVIFVVNRGEMGLAIGRSGETIKKVQKAIGKQVELVEWSDDATQFVMNSLNPQLVSEIRMSEKPDWSKMVTVVVNEKKKGAVLGKGGRNAEKARLLAKRYFSIETIHIVASE